MSVPEDFIHAPVSVSEVEALRARIAGLEAALRTWNKAFSQIPCWARKWDAFREARSAAKAALDDHKKESPQ